MHSGFEIPGIHHHQHQQQQPENSCSPLLLSMNPTHILDQIHTSTTQHHHFLPPHHYAAAPTFPLNFKLGLNEICSTNHLKNSPDSLLRGSEQYQLPDARQSSLPMLHPPFWEPLQTEASNENSDIVDTLELNQRETLTTSMDAKSRLHFSELDAIYKRLTNSDTTPTTLPIPNPGSDQPDPPSPSKKNKSRKKKTKRTTSSSPPPPPAPMAEFFEDLVKQVMDHQESLQKKFTQVMDRLNEERRAREEAWRNEELAHFEREAAARAHEKALAMSREAMIVSYLEKITGQRINLPPLVASEITATNTSDGSN